MSRIVQLNHSSPRFPTKCCGCGSAKFDNAQHKNSNVISPIGIIFWKSFSLRIPICGKCKNRPAIVMGLVILFSIFLLYAAVMSPISGGIIYLLWFIITVALIAYALLQKPIKVLNADHNKPLVRIQFKNNEYTEQEHKDWLEESGFGLFKRTILSDGSSIISARKKI